MNRSDVHAIVELLLVAEQPQYFRNQGHLNDHIVLPQIGGGLADARAVLGLERANQFWVPWFRSRASRFRRGSVSMSSRTSRFRRRIRTTGLRRCGGNARLSRRYGLYRGRVGLPCGILGFATWRWSWRFSFVGHDT